MFVTLHAAGINSSAPNEPIGVGATDGPASASRQSICRYKLLGDNTHVADIYNV